MYSSSSYLHPGVDNENVADDKVHPPEGGLRHQPRPGPVGLDVAPLPVGGVADHVVEVQRLGRGLQQFDLVPPVVPVIVIWLCYHCE